MYARPKTAPSFPKLIKFYPKKRQEQTIWPDMKLIMSSLKYGIALVIFFQTIISDTIKP